MAPVVALHAVFSPGRGICLWAEDARRPAHSPSRARRTARPHPFAVPADELAALLPGTAATPGQAVLLLPSGPRAPRDSPDLARDDDPDATPSDDPDAAPSTLAAWSVPVLELDGPPPPDPDGLTGSASLAVLRALDGFAADLVGRGRVLPVLDGADGDGTLRWRPVLQGADLVAADAFAAALPPAARAEQTGAGDEAGTDAQAVVDEVLDAGVDAHARRRLADLPADDVPGWLAGLVVEHPGTAGHPDTADLPPAGLPDGLAAGLGRWQVVGAPWAGPARATFRLTEIVVDDLGHAVDEADGGPRWWLEFALQSTQDPSLLVPAETVWRDAAALRRWLDEPEELLLGELGRASRLYPELADALRVARPTGTELDATGTHHFLAHVAADLDRAGFGVLLPSWWERPAELGLSATAAGNAPEGVVAVRSRLGKDDLVDFSWRLVVDGEQLDDAEMRALVEAKAPLVRLRGRWVAVDPERLRTGLEFLRRRAEKGSAETVGDVLHLASAHPDDLDLPLPLESLEADGALGDLLAGTAPSTLEMLDAPAGLDATLRPYQQRGVSWLAFLASLGVGGVLADDMGLGKTLQVLALEAHERSRGATDPATDPAGVATPGPTLLVCPTSVVSTWQREAARFVPGLRVAVHHGPGRVHGDALAELAAGTDLLVTSYGTLTRDVDDLAATTFHRVVLDEAQLVKNSRSRAARAVRRIGAAHRLALTGTPVENRLGELWSVMDAVNPGLLGTAAEFRERYAVPVERHGRTDVARTLRERTRPFLLRRLKTDPTVVDDLPEKIETIERCSLSTEQASLYQVVVDEMLEKIDASEGVERRGRVLAAMTKLKQVCDHPALLLHDGSAMGRRSGKIARLEEILSEVLAAGDRALLFTQFTEFGDMLAPHLAARFDTDVSWLHGGTSRPARDRMVERFQSGDGPSLFLLSLKAGGTGLTLTAAQHVVHLDRWWNPAVEDQATDRAFRIGQKRTVGVRKLVCAGTLEERIDDLITSKRALADMAVSEGEDWVTELSTDDLARVLSLDPSATTRSEDDDDPDGPDGPDGDGPGGEEPDDGA